MDRERRKENNGFVSFQISQSTTLRKTSFQAGGPALKFWSQNRRQFRGQTSTTSCSSATRNPACSLFHPLARGETSIYTWKTRFFSCIGEAGSGKHATPLSPTNENEGGNPRFRVRVPNQIIPEEDGDNDEWTVNVIKIPVAGCARLRSKEGEGGGGGEGKKSLYAHSHALCLENGCT